MLNALAGLQVGVDFGGGGGCNQSENLCARLGKMANYQQQQRDQGGYCASRQVHPLSEDCDFFWARGAWRKGIWSVCRTGRVVWVLAQFDRSAIACVARRQTWQLRLSDSKILRVPSEVVERESSKKKRHSRRTLIEFVEKRRD